MFFNGGFFIRRKLQTTALHMLGNQVFEARFMKMQASLPQPFDFTRIDIKSGYLPADLDKTIAVVAPT